MKKYFFLLAIIVAALAAIYKIIQPRNFEECILEKTKGLDRYYASIAEKYCEIKFPYEKEIFDTHNITTSWSSDNERIYINIEKNYSPYAITKIKAKFSRLSCNESDHNKHFTLNADFYFNNNNSHATARLPGLRMQNLATHSDAEPKSYHCMRTETIYGKRVR